MGDSVLSALYMVLGWLAILLAFAVFFGGRREILNVIYNIFAVGAILAIVLTAIILVFALKSISESRERKRRISEMDAGVGVLGGGDRPEAELKKDG